MKEIILITDYKGIFGSKQKSKIYRGGMDVPRIISLFRSNGYDSKAISFAQLDHHEVSANRPLILYTSSEDKYGLYKSFIEDIVFGLEQQGATILPAFKFLRAHNNKVFMEYLRKTSDYFPIKTINSQFFGTCEELKANLSIISFPAVIKPASGAMSRGVFKALDGKGLLKAASKIAGSQDIFHDTKEILRKIKYGQNYIKESSKRNKFIVQNFIPGLSNDWKVLVYGNKCFVLFRKNRKNDFRASGSGNFIFTKDIPVGMLDFAYNIKEYFNVPHISLDIGFDGSNFHLIEFQFLYFGTTTLEKSTFYFYKLNDEWFIKDESSNLEKVYVESIIDYLTNRHI